MRRWLILREGERRRWGGDLRRRYLFDGLLERTAGVALEDRRRGPIRRALRDMRGPRWHVWRRRPLVASSELLTDEQLAPVLQLGTPAVVDIHDDPVLQAEAVGAPIAPEQAAELRRRLDTNLAAFRIHVAPSRSFARLAGMDPSRTIVAANGCDPTHIVPLPFPEEPVVGYVSAAAPGRGIASLIDAARMVRGEIPRLRLRLWLTATGEASQAYLDGIRAATADEPWIEIGTVPYADLSAALGSAAVLCVPHPANRYLDTAVPVKLFDSMAAGRPVVVTPRVETATIVSECGAGLVTAGDQPEDLAGVIAHLLRDRELARRLGANARAAAEERFAWPVIGARLADEILARIR